MLTTASKYILMFFFYSAAGWLGESIYRSIGERRIINSGFLTGPMCPIYGTGAMVLTVFIYPFRENLWVVFFLGLLLCDIVEYITSFLMEKLFHARWWDYSEEFLNIKGRICLKHTFYWGAASVGFVKVIHPQTDKLFAMVSEDVYVYIAAVVLVIFFIDVVNAVKKAADIAKLQQKFQQLVHSVEQMPSTVADNIEELASDLKLEFARTSDKIVDKRRDAAVEILDFISEVEQWMKTAKKQLRFRQISNNPGFRKNIDNTITKAKNAIEKVSQNFNKYTG